MTKKIYISIIFKVIFLLAIFTIINGSYGFGYKASAAENVNSETPQVSAGVLAIEGTTTEMEYKIGYFDSVNYDWISCTDVTTNVPRATIYLVRYKETSDKYDGSFTRVYVKAIDLNTVPIRISSNKFYYTGSWIKPTFTVEGLTKGKDYTYSYVNNKSPGKGTVCFHGINNYTGNVKINFDIVLDKVANINTKLIKYNGVNITWDKVDKCSRYKVYCKKSTDSNWTFLKRTSLLYYDALDLEEGVKYDFQVEACYQFEQGLTDNLATSSIYTLGKMKSPNVSRFSSSIVRLRWSRANEVSGYEVVRSKTAIGGYSIVKTTNYWETEPCIKSGKGIKYFYKVRSYKIVNGKKIYAPWSEPTCFTIK